jgi:hypothetical protein
MRVVGEIAHPQVKITIFHWNNRYLVKFEDGPLEQTFKLSEFDFFSDDEVRKLIDEEFIQNTLIRFQEMEHTLAAAQSRHQ